MATEKEKKFLVKDWKKVDIDTNKMLIIKQFIIGSNEDYVTRIRIETSQQGKVVSTLTIKSNKAEKEREEYEMVVPNSYAERYSKEVDESQIIRKVRYPVKNQKTKSTVDVFSNGVILLEIEYDSEDDIVIPEWVGEEVTGNPLYYGYKG